jgi:predicted Zn-dependent peptidase
MSVKIMPYRVQSIIAKEVVCPMQSDLFQRTSVNGLRIHVLPTDRFKTYAVSLFIGHPLAEQTVTANALIPFVLRRGSRQYPETKQFREKLDELYGAGFGFDVYKRGNNQIVQFRMDTVADRYAGSHGQGLLRETLQFLLQAVTDPALDAETGRFVGKYVQSEKETVRARLQAIINDKIRYAAERCVQEMFADDPFRFNALGSADALDKLDANGLYDHYRRWLADAQMDLYVAGETTLEEVAELAGELWKGVPGDKAAYSIGENRDVRSDVRRITERLDVSQGKLNIGLNMPIYYHDDRYPAAMMYNGILGRYPHSKLFLNVREKASLAYYVSSQMDGFKGMMMIHSGIETNQYEQALRIIEEQLDAMAAGQISDLEIEQTVAMMENQMREVGDSAFDMIGFDFNTVLTGRRRTTDEVIEAIRGVTREQIQDIARSVRLDTIYFLSDRKGESGA